MPILSRLIEIGDSAVGFLLPAFKHALGANCEVIQRIDQNDLVVSFDLIECNSQIRSVESDYHESNVGSPAIWAFRDQNSCCHIGTAQDIQKVGHHLLASNALDAYPLAAAEMAAFCEAEVSKPKVLRAAFKRLAAFSLTSAEVWRDAVLFLPLIKSDIARQIRLGREEKALLDQVIAVTTAGTTHIYAPASIAEQTKHLHSWSALSRVFGVEDFRIHALTQKTTTRVDAPPQWFLIGSGGVARWVIENSPFRGDIKDISGVPNVVGAVAAIPPIVPFQSACKYTPLLVAIVSSDKYHVDEIDLASRALSLNSKSRHLINIRPLGFGTPKSHKLTPKEIKNRLSEFDYVWIVANHRQRQVSAYKTMLYVSNTAARFARAAAQSLIDCISSQDGQMIFGFTEKIKGFGLIGAYRFNGNVSRVEIVRRVVYSMLCEDAYLYTAKKILCFWPYDLLSSERFCSIRLGERIYDVELITRNNTRNRDVVGFALDVQLSMRNEEDFGDFCVSLLSAYDFKLIRADKGMLLLKNGGVALRILPIQSISQFPPGNARAEGAGENNLIITNQTIPAALSTWATREGVDVIHYSELSRWMKRKLGLELFDFQGHETNW